MSGRKRKKLDLGDVGKIKFFTTELDLSNRLDINRQEPAQYKDKKNVMRFRKPWLREVNISIGHILGFFRHFENILFQFFFFLTWGRWVLKDENEAGPTGNLSPLELEGFLSITMEFLSLWRNYRTLSSQASLKFLWYYFLQSFFKYLYVPQIFS